MNILGMNKENTWFISDTHFSHNNIIGYCDRPFASTDEMDEVIIENWNSLVKPEDTIYHLGDIGFCGAEKLESIVKRLNGKKRLRMGNHDKATATKYRKMGFEEVYNSDFSIFIEGYNQIAFSHYPISEHRDPFNIMDDPQSSIVNVHGHTHNENTGLNPNRYKCISVELIDYKPIHISKILEWAKEKK